MKASHDFDSFIKCCATEPKKALVIKPVPKDAREIFQLNTTDEILAFIGNNGLEKPVFINTKIWEKNPNPNEPIYVDAYEFWSLGKHCYIAFMFNPKSQIWIIKSLHLSENTRTLGDAFKIANIDWKTK